jgi:hypothetical protein
MKQYKASTRALPYLTEETDSDGSLAYYENSVADQVDLDGVIARANDPNTPTSFKLGQIVFQRDIERIRVLVDSTSNTWNYIATQATP